MEIEFQNLDGRLEVIEHTIRDTKLGYEFDQAIEPTKHLQARLLVNDFDEDCLDCSISYYSESNDFLGLDDSGAIHLNPSHDKSIAVSLPMDIPDDAVRVVVRFIFQDDVSAAIGFYGYVFRALSIVAVAWLAMMAFNSIN